MNCMAVVSLKRLRLPVTVRHIILMKIIAHLKFHFYISRDHALYKTGKAKSAILSMLVMYSTDCSINILAIYYDGRLRLGCVKFCQHQLQSADNSEVKKRIKDLRRTCSWASKVDAPKTSPGNGRHVFMFIALCISNHA